MQNLFRQQSMKDCEEDYQRSLRKSDFLRWDYVVITASNETQAESYRAQIRRRLAKKALPAQAKYMVIPDPDGKRVGSGGATLNVLRYLAEDIGAAGDAGIGSTVTGPTGTDRIAADTVGTDHTAADIAGTDCTAAAGAVSSHTTGAFGTENIYSGKRILIIHSGGDSKRIPQYSAIGKLFSPVPRELPDGRPSTLFDELIIAMSGVPSRMRDGAVVLSGDALLLFNPLQLNADFSGAAAISFREPVETGKDHGVFLGDGHGTVGQFLHKQTVETLTRLGAVNEQGLVNLDTGAVMLSAKLLSALYSLVSTDGRPDKSKLDAFINDRARVSFYGDFLYPLATGATLEQYYKEKPEGSFTPELHDCRTKIWNAISDFDMKLLCLAPARFLHFGTTTELAILMSTEIDDFEFLDWKRHVLPAGGTGAEGNQTAGTAAAAGDGISGGAKVPAEAGCAEQRRADFNGKRYASYSSYVGHDAVIGGGAYLEDSYVLGHTKVGEGSILSHVRVRDLVIPAGVVLHGLPLADGKWICRIYPVDANPKNELRVTDDAVGEAIWGGKGDGADDSATDSSGMSFHTESPDHSLWNARIYPVCDSMDEAAAWALRVYQILFVSGHREEDIVPLWRSLPRMSLAESFNAADAEKILAWEDELRDRIVSRNFTDKLAAGVYYKDALDCFRNTGMTAPIYRTLLQDAEEVPLPLRIRIYYAAAQYLKEHDLEIDGETYDVPERRCFAAIADAIYGVVTDKLPDSSLYHIEEDRVDVKLPVRVNFGGGWTDTPPYCNENGGVVLNAAISLGGRFPIQVTVKRLPEYHIEFESADLGAHGTFDRLEDIRNCHDPYDNFVLHKAALIATGIIPLTDNTRTLPEILRRLGGGIYLSTEVVGIPKGSGLGTSSILAGACVKALFRFLGERKTDNEIYEVVLCLEQIMSTGGGWQDQVGGLTRGFKLITSKQGLRQELSIEPLRIPAEAMEELGARFALIYTGQRRLARNLLRDVMGNYIGARPASVEALSEMKKTAALMAFDLEQGDVDGFARLLDHHWELSKQLDAGSTNTCIDQIFASCEDLLSARFICGAGGGGFLMVILKKGVTKDALRARLRYVFQDSGVAVWDAEFV